MMLRALYQQLLRMHPPRFRERFAEEMMSIFDCAERGAAAKLVLDAFVSLIRQRAFRWGYWHQPAGDPVSWSPQGPPVFYIFPRYKLERRTVLAGVMAGIMTFCAAWAVARYTWNHPVYMPFRGQWGEQKILVGLPVATAAAPAARLGANAGAGGTSPPVIYYYPPEESSSASSATRAATQAAVQGKTTPPASSTVPETAIPPSSRARHLLIPQAKPAAAQNEALQAFAGEYATDEPQSPTIVVTVQDAHLAIKVPGEPLASLALRHGTTFASRTSPHCAAQFTMRGRIAERIVLDCNGRRLAGRRK